MSWKRKLFPRSLRSRLILAFGLTVSLSLFLAGLMAILLLREEQERTARERVGRLAEPVALRTAILEAGGAGPAQIQDALERQYGVRILLIDRDSVVVGDSEQTLRGRQISELAEQGVPARPLSDLRFRVQRFRAGPENLLLFSSPQGVLAAVPGVPGVGVPKYQAVIAADESDFGQAWRELLPRLAIAGGIALAVGTASAALLARSITRPLQKVTAASEQMALGRYDQQLGDYGGEEVGRLTRAFNAMARQVSRSHRTLREFLANVSHELKTPLTSIQGFSQAMVDGSLQRREDFVEAGKIINAEALRMRSLVDDLLYLSRVEGGDVVLQIDDVDAGDLLEATRERFRRRAQEAQVGLTVDAGQPTLVRADPRRVEQALANLVDNAIRHTPSGGRVHLRCAAEDGIVRLSVHNTGSYVPPEIRTRIFERFFRADSARTDGSTGLGLAITKEIVEAHGGHVEVGSEAGAGTEFTIILPIDRATDRREGRASSRGPGEKGLSR